MELSSSAGLIPNSEIKSGDWIRGTWMDVTGHAHSMEGNVVQKPAGLFVVNSQGDHPSQWKWEIPVTYEKSVKELSKYDVGYKRVRIDHNPIG